MGHISGTAPDLTNLTDFWPLSDEQYLPTHIAAFLSNVPVAMTFSKFQLQVLVTRAISRAIFPPLQRT
jgi:hypothetical protein